MVMAHNHFAHIGQEPGECMLPPTSENVILSPYGWFIRNFCLVLAVWVGTIRAVWACARTNWNEARARVV